MVWGEEKNFEDILTISKDRLNSVWLIKWLSYKMLFSLSFMFIQNHERNGCNIWEMSFGLKLRLIYITIFERNEGSYELFFLQEYIVSAGLMKCLSDFRIWFEDFNSLMSPALIFDCDPKPQDLIQLTSTQGSFDEILKFH